MAAQAGVGLAAAQPHSKLQLHISCSKLKRMDLLTKSDPYVVVLLRTSDRWVEVGRTEVVQNASDVQFAAVIDIDFYFEQVQPICFKVYDMDHAGLPDAKQDFIGSCETHLGAIFGIHHGRYADRLVSPTGKHTGNILVAVEESKDCKGLVRFTVCGEHLDKKDLFGKSDPYFTISRATAQGWTPIFKSEVIKKTLNPAWKSCVIPIRNISNGDLNRPLQFDVHDWDRIGGHDFIGAAQTTLATLLGNADGMANLPLINPKLAIAKGAKYSNSGVLKLHCVLEPEHSFLDYIQAGHELHFAVAIDFTASNGDPRSPSSLHFCNPHALNVYQQAIVSIGSILEDYDTDKLFPVYGFGAKDASGTALPVFSLNGSPSNPCCKGVSGILDAYQKALWNVTLWGPTNFAPTIRQAADVARSHAHHYHVLLIITDGAISDFDASCKEIVEASSLPLSIIIIGVGHADFSSMVALDSDEKMLEYQGRRAERDIVQFVALSKLEAALLVSPEQQRAAVARVSPTLERSEENSALTAVACAQEVLAELPEQFLSYMKARSIAPRR